MKNLAMKRKLDAGKCLDVSQVGKQPANWKGPGAGDVFELEEFVPDMDYADVRTERWMWCIAKRKEDGKIFAAPDKRFYNNGDYECLAYLR